jgi:hypothetical protein
MWYLSLRRKRMKRYLIVIAAFFLIAGLVGQVKASCTPGDFCEDDLIRVIYSTTNSSFEEASDLGSFATLKSTGSLTDTAGLTLSTFASSSFSTAGDLQVAYFVENGDLNGQTKELVTSGPKGGNETIVNKAAATTILGSFSSVVQYYQQTQTGIGTGTFASSGSNVMVQKNNGANSYYSVMDGNSTLIGSFAGLLAAGSGPGEASLVNNGTVALGLYDWTTLAKFTTAQPFLTLDTAISSSGAITTSVESSSAPIPPSVLLFGTGLLGLIGLGRKAS